MKWIITLLLAAAAHGALADSATDCKAAGGSYMSGVVSSAPVWVGGKEMRNVELSHTKLNFTSNADGKQYQAAIDNVFAQGYDIAGDAVPAPLNTLQVGDNIELCGVTYPGGIHYVHTNCGCKPQRGQADGWVHKINADGSVSANLEGSQEYCYLWPCRTGNH
ncbi:hypothetical protein SAMN02745857_03616 [Andreprevotia lacus DSM 23236]|uniref:Uncharacterized protein n=1 Tax=Andreprevotia lacus DSM 23236 TaxID=1121001 RepID=A0A1W1XZ36_9NEIS|nr:hypothetical protein [Andreprevotia lacus]SMC29117.1 hypothetical protein SAMN02745857_03616 [Andreprevotia lacus DSM 23236]